MELKSQSNVSRWFCIFCTIALYLSQHGFAESIVPEGQEVPALIVFGDSIVDPGNNNYIATLTKCNFHPYGRDFKGGKATGRFCNGKIPTDYMAKQLGLKELLPAYLDPNLKTSDLLTGVSFASGATGYDSLTSKITTVISMSDQLSYFKDYIKKIKSAVGEEKAGKILSKSIVIVCAGSDDIANTYFLTKLRKVQYNVDMYTNLMIGAASNFLQQLHGLGVRRIGVMGTPALGCVPSQRTIGGGLGRACYEDSNNASMVFNAKLSTLLTSMGKKYKDAKFVYLDSYKPLLDIIQKASQYGFKVVNKGCCGTGNIEVSLLCNPATPTCSNADEYIFWDSYHPTQRAYEILSPLIMKANIHKFF